MMKLSEDAYKHLEIAFVMDKLTVHTPYGETMKKQMTAFGPKEREALSAELDAVEAMLSLMQDQRYAFIEFRNHFKRIKDLRGTFNRLRHRETLSATELFEIKSLSLNMKRISAVCEKLGRRLPEGCVVCELPEVDTLLDPTGSGVETFYVYDAYSDVLSVLRNDIKQLEDQLAYERKKQKLYLEDLLDIRIRPNGEVTVPKDDKVLMERIADSGAFVYSAETYMNTSFKIRLTENALNWTCDLEGLKNSEEEAEFEVRKALSQKLLEWVDSLEENTQRIGRLDLWMAKAAFAMGYQCVRPTLVESGIHIELGRHIKVESQLKADNRHYEAINLSVNPGVTCITGANMGGKTVSLKLLGMLTAMAQFGIFVPAKAMSFAPRDFILTSIGDLQNIDQGLSTFGAEIVKVSDAVKVAMLDGLILIDELARGTNPREGYAISKAIIDHLARQASISVITTHFDGLADGEGVKHLQVKGLSDADFGQIMLEMENNPSRGLSLLHESMDYQLIEVTKPEEVPKDAIRIAKLMGLDEGILESAKAALRHRI